MVERRALLSQPAGAVGPPVPTISLRSLMPGGRIRPGHGEAIADSHSCRIDKSPVFYLEVD